MKGQQCVYAPGEEGSRQGESFHVAKRSPSGRVRQWCQETGSWQPTSSPGREAVWGPHEPALRDGSATPQARSGGGPGEGFLADTRRSNGGRVSRELQMPEDLPDHLAVRDGGDGPQRPLRIEWAAHHVKSKDALAQLRPAPVRTDRT